jgi:hypothetical protein
MTTDKMIRGQHPSDASQQDNPELDRILRELGAFSQAQQHQQNEQIAPSPVPVPFSAPPNPPTQKLMTESTKPAAPPPPMIDPATIFEWREGLRCVDKMRSKNPRFGNVVKTVRLTPRNTLPRIV